ncbi:hypothetical protein ACFL10_01705, partial [Patescibacteria group bacterium]
LTRVEQEILEEQRQAIFEDPDWDLELYEPHHEQLGRLLNERERVFLDSYGRPGYHFVPVDNKNASFNQLRAFFRKAPVSPLLFQESIVSNVYGTEFEAKPNSEERMRERQAHFDELRKLFASLQPVISTKRQHMAKDRIRRMFVISLDEAKGAMLVTRKPGKRRINGVYPDVYSATRSLDHILHTYRGRFTDSQFEKMGELKTLRKLQSSTQFLIDFIQKWKATTTEEKNMAGQLITDARDLLAECQNAYKVFACGDYDSATEFEDSREKVNPGATAAKLVKAYNELKKRLEEIVSIKKVITSDKKTLDTLLKHLNSRCYDTIIELGELLETEYFDEYEQKSGQNSRIKHEARTVREKIFLGDRKCIFNEMVKLGTDKRMPAPYQQYGTAVLSNLSVTIRLLEYIDENKDDIAPERLKEFHDALTTYGIRAHIVLRYQYIQRRYHEILSEILQDPYKIKPKQVQSRIDNLLVQFRPHQYKLPFAIRDDLKIEVPEFDSVYEHLRAVSQKIRDWINSRDKVKGELDKSSGKIEDPYAIPQDDEATVNRIQVLEEQLTSLEIEFINELYELMSGFDFMVPLKALTVEDADEVISKMI